MQTLGFVIIPVSLQQQGRPRPSLYLFLAITGDLLIVYEITVFGLPGITPISPATALLVPGLLVFLIFIVNDSFKIFLVRRFHPYRRIDPCR